MFYQNSTYLKESKLESFKLIQQMSLWFQNRGRLASKCGVAPPSPRSAPHRKRDATKSLSSWTREEIEEASAHRHFSTSDIENFARHSMINGYKDARPASNSSTASEGSDLHDDGPFSPKSGTDGHIITGKGEHIVTNYGERRS